MPLTIASLDLCGTKQIMTVCLPLFHPAAILHQNEWENNRGVRQILCLFSLNQSPRRILKHDILRALPSPPFFAWSLERVDFDFNCWKMRTRKWRTAQINKQQKSIITTLDWPVWRKKNIWNERFYEWLVSYTFNVSIHNGFHIFTVEYSRKKGRKPAKVRDRKNASNKRTNNLDNDVYFLHCK